MSDTKQKALDYLKSNADITEIFATSDGFLFTKKADATEHAKTLTEDEPEVETFTNTAIPDDKLSGKDIQELIDAETADLTHENN